MTTLNLWDAAKAVLRGKFTAIQSYLKKQEKHRKDNLTLHLKQLENEEEKKKTKTISSTNIWRLKNTFLNSQQVIEEIKREIKNI